MGYIYMIRNKINNNIYIGQSKQNDIEIRWRDHKRRINTNGCPYLYAAFRKYGIENFDFLLICICFDEACNELEKYYIKKYNSLVPNGYNLDNGGNTLKSLHPETKEKIRLAHLGKKHSDERIQKNRESHIGYKHKESSKEKMSLARKGKKLSEKIKKNMSRAQLGHKTHETTKKAVSDANKRRIWTEEMRLKISKTIKEKNIHNKGVNQYNMNNELIASYKSIKEASEITKISHSCISRVCRGDRNKSGGYIWKFSNCE